MSNRLEKDEGQMAGNTNQIAENTLQLGEITRMLKTLVAANQTTWGSRGQ